jgi:hypothetical protein
MELSRILSTTALLASPPASKFMMERPLMVVFRKTTSFSTISPSSPNHPASRSSSPPWAPSHLLSAPAAVSGEALVAEAGDKVSNPPLYPRRLDRSPVGRERRGIFRTGCHNHRTSSICRRSPRASPETNYRGVPESTLICMPQTGQGNVPAPKNIATATAITTPTKQHNFRLGLWTKVSPAPAAADELKITRNRATSARRLRRRYSAPSSGVANLPSGRSYCGSGERRRKNPISLD